MENDEILDGYDVEPADKINNDLFCSICLKLMRFAVELECGHGLCEGCWKSLRKRRRSYATCPNCRAEIDEEMVRPAKVIRRMVQSQHVVCSEKSFGCDWTGELRDLQKHLNVKCLYAYATCPLGDCNISLRRWRLTIHMKVCEYRMITCEYCEHKHTWKFKPVDDLETLPSNLLAKNLVEAICAMNEENSKETQCDDCEEDMPSTYCLVCHQKLCDACVLDHKRKRKFKGHNMAPLKDVTQEELVRSFYHLCKKHAKELKLYCETCDAVVCQTCTRSRQHIDHRHLLLEEIVGEKKEILEIILKATKEIN